MCAYTKTHFREHAYLRPQSNKSVAVASSQTIGQNTYLLIDNASSLQQALCQYCKLLINWQSYPVQMS